MTENNQNIDFSTRLSEMDKIFIPKDLDSNVSLEQVAEYQYNLKFWRSVPENFRLVKINRITQRIKTANGYGLKLVWPLLTKTILVPAEMLDGKKEYKNVDCLSLDKIEISVDLTIIMNITDPVKYKRKGSTQLDKLDPIIKRLLRIYVAGKNFDQIVKEECKITEFDTNEALNTFEEECGIKVNKVIFEKVQLPERLKKLYNDAAEEEQKRKAQAVRLQAEKEKAKAEAEMVDIKAKAEAKRIKVVEEANRDSYIKRINELVETLQARGIPAAEIAEQLKLEIASKSGNAIFMSGNNKNNDMASAVYAGNVASENRKETQYRTNTETGEIYTNSEILIDKMDLIAMLKGILSPEYQKLKEELSTPGNPKKEYIDKLNKEKFQKVLETLHFGNITQENPQKGPKR